MHANYIHLQKLPFASELDLTMMFFIVITCHLIITQLLKHLFALRIDSNFVLYLSLLLLFMIISNIFSLVTINGFQYSMLKIYLYCSIVYTIVIFLLFFGFREFLFFDFEKQFKKLNSHLTTILSDIYHYESFEFSFELFLAISILFSGFFTFLLLPSIARFAENYVKIIGQYYAYADKSKKEKNTIKTSEKPSENKEELLNSEQQAEKVLKDRKNKEQEDKIRWILKLFNLRLIFNLLILFFFAKPMMLPWVSFIGSEEMITILRILFCLSYAILVAGSHRYELEIHFSKIYDTIKSLLVDPGNENLKKVQNRVSNLLQTSLMITYIIVTKFIIPLILLYLLIYKTNFTIKSGGNIFLFRNHHNLLRNNDLKLSELQRNEVIMYALDWNCMASRNYKEIWRQITKECPLNQKLVMGKFGMGYGFFYKDDKDFKEDFVKVLKELMRKINHYGLIPDEFYQNLLSFWLFNYFMANYFLTVFYIIFLRKSSNF